jgi:flagellar protein FliS
MVPANFLDEYRRNAINTSSQGKLILMMYDGAIKFVKLAIKNQDKNDISGKSTYIRKTHDIINELSCCLDLKKGGPVSEKLENLYRFMLRQLTLANIKNDRKALESVLKVLSTLNEAWEQVVQKTEPMESGATSLTQPAKSIAAQC